MWRLLKADLQNRLGLMLAAFGLVLGCGLGLSLIASSTEPILGWVVSASIVVPTLINIVGGSTDAREHRLQLHRVLPVATVGPGILNGVNAEKILAYFPYLTQLFLNVLFTE